MQHNLPSLPPPTPPFPSRTECGKWHGSVCDHVMSLPHMQVWLNILGIAGLGPQVWEVFCYISTPMTRALVCFCVHFVLCSLIEHFSMIFSYHQHISRPLPLPPLYNNDNNHTTPFVTTILAIATPFATPTTTTLLWQWLPYHLPFVTLTTTTSLWQWQQPYHPFCDHYFSYRNPFCDPYHHHPFTTTTTTTISPFHDHYHPFRVTTILAIATPFATPTTTTLLQWPWWQPYHPRVRGVCHVSTPNDDREDWCVLFSSF